MAQQVFYSRHSGGITIYMDGKPLTVSSSHMNFSAILQALRDKAFDKAKMLMDITSTINTYGVSKRFAGRRVYVENGKVYYLDEHKKARQLAGPLVKRILDDLAKPHGEKYADALLMFCDNVMKNKQKDIREELWQFLESGKTPITMDGCFLAYKKVRYDFKDIYTGTMDNSPGEIPRMKQKDVDTDRNRTCSRGLHFCSRGYLDSYSSRSSIDRVVIVKVNPRHVFAIPTDYSFQKGRASEYYVVGEVKDGWDSSADIFKDSFIDEDTKLSAAPDVAFKAPLKASLASVAKSYGLMSDGRVQVVERDGENVPVRLDNSGTGWVDIIGTPVVGTMKLMSIETKSVRAAVKAAIEKAES